MWVSPYEVSKELIEEFDLTLVDLGEGLRKQDFSPNQML